MASNMGCKYGVSLPTGDQITLTRGIHGERYVEMRHWTPTDTHRDDLTEDRPPTTMIALTPAVMREHIRSMQVVTYDSEW